MEYPSRPHGLEATDRTGNNYAIYSGPIYIATRFRTTSSIAIATDVFSAV